MRQILHHPIPERYRFYLFSLIWFSFSPQFIKSFTPEQETMTNWAERERDIDFCIEQKCDRARNERTYNITRAAYRYKSSLTTEQQLFENVFNNGICLPG